MNEKILVNISMSFPFLQLNQQSYIQRFNLFTKIQNHEFSLKQLYNQTIMNQQHNIQNSESYISQKQVTLNLPLRSFAQKAAEQPLSAQILENHISQIEQSIPKNEPIAQNCKKSASKCEEWNFQDESLLIKLHNEKGNKWVQIARQLKRQKTKVFRNDNSVKNHYYSLLRRSLRKLNYCITEQLNSELRPIKINIIGKIVQSAEALYRGQECQQKQITLMAFALKNKLLDYTQLNQQYISNQKIIQIKSLVSEVSSFENRLKISLRPAGKSKSCSHKYKGKQIITLLNQNKKNQAISNNSKRPTQKDQEDVPCTHHLLENHTTLKQQFSQKEVKIENRRPQNKVPSILFVRNNPNYFLFQEFAYPMQPMYYDFYQQSLLRSDLLAPFAYRDRILTDFSQQSAPSKNIQNVDAYNQNLKVFQTFDSSML